MTATVPVMPTVDAPERVTSEVWVGEEETAAPLFQMMLSCNVTSSPLAGAVVNVIVMLPLASTVALVTGSEEPVTVTLLGTTPADPNGSAYPLADWYRFEIA